MTHYWLEANIAVGFEVEAAFEWYEAEVTSLGMYFSKNYDRRINEFSTTLWPFKKSAQASAAP